MAERRMFAKTIVLSDAFLDMPMSARCLYFTLGMLADDDGFVNAPRAIMRQCGASDDDMKLLLAKKFVLLFDSGVIVIKHWRINNYLQKDRINPTKYIEEKAQLTVDAKGSYHREEPKEDDVYTPVYTQEPDPVYTQDSIGKVSIGKDSIEENNNNLSISLSEKKSQNSTSDKPARSNHVRYWADRLRIFREQGFDTDGVYDLAEANGVSRSELDSYTEEDHEEETV